MTPDQSAPTSAPACPKCQGPMWDNREGKRNPKAPDFKCKDKSCDGVIWPPRGAVSASAPSATPAASAPAVSGAARPAAGAALADGMPACPICGGAMWDDRESKRNPKAPDFKCKNKPRERGDPGCEGVIWPSRDGSPSPYPASAPRASSPRMSAPPRDEAPPPTDRDAPSFDDDDDLPF